MAINKVMVVGNLGADPVVGALPNSGQNVAHSRWQPQNSSRIATAQSSSVRNGSG